MLGIFRLGTFGWESWLGNFRLGTFVWKHSLRNLRSRTLAWDTWLENCHLESFARSNWLDRQTLAFEVTFQKTFRVPLHESTNCPAQSQQNICKKTIVRLFEKEMRGQQIGCSRLPVLILTQNQTSVYYSFLKQQNVMPGSGQSTLIQCYFPRRENSALRVLWVHRTSLACLATVSILLRMGILPP